MNHILDGGSEATAGYCQLMQYKNSSKVTFIADLKVRKQDIINLKANFLAHRPI